MNLSLPSARDPQTYAIIGAAMEVHRELGHKFLEAVYKDSLDIEFWLRGIASQREVSLPVYYKGQLLPSTYRADFVCFETIVVECKAIDVLGGTHRSQLINYLNAVKLRRGLLINFGSTSLEYERFVL